MKKLLPVVAAVFIISLAKAQPVAYSYYLDTDLNSVEKSKATIFGNGSKENGLFRLDCYTIKDGKLLLTVHFRDSSLADLEGPYTSYHYNGKAERTGNYKNGTEEGAWVTRDDLGYIADSIVYRSGKPLIIATYSYHRNYMLSYYTFNDSLQQVYQAIAYDKDGQKKSEVYFKGQRGVYKTYTDGTEKTDSLFTREETNAQYPGGDQAWSDYLKKNLNPGVASGNHAPKGTYIVIIGFYINPDGAIDEIKAETSHGFGMEAEAERVIRNSGKWLAASQYGRSLRSFKRVPVSFSVTE